MIDGHVFISFQEMYQRAVKIDRALNETEAESWRMGLAKRKFGLEDLAARGTVNPGTSTAGSKENKSC